MSDDVMPPGLLLRDNARGRDAAGAVAAARGLEHERRLRRLVTVGGGWVAAGMMTLVAGGCLAVVLTRPVPKAQVYVSLLHDDGSYDAPVVRDDLPQSRRDMLFRYTVMQYILARENYSYEGINANYRLASVLSAPAERERYQSLMLDKKNPENPVVIYGDGLNASIADVQSNVQIRVDPASPGALDAIFLVKVTAPNQPARMVRKTARLTWMPADDQIPLEVQQQHDPLGIAFTHYSSTPDPEAVR